MAALATLSDVQARVARTITTGEHARVNALIADASAAVRLFTRQQIDQNATTARLAVRNINRQAVVILPERPAVSIATVEDIHGNTVSYEWDGKQVLEIEGRTESTFTDTTLSTRLDYVDVTYTHGYGDDNDPRGVLATVAGVVAGVVARAFGTPAEETGKTAESIGTYSYSIGAGAAQGGFGLLRSEKETLSHALGRRRAGTIQL